MFVVVFVFKLKTAYEMRSSDWSSDVCSSDLEGGRGPCGSGGCGGCFVGHWGAGGCGGAGAVGALRRVGPRRLSAERPGEAGLPRPALDRTSAGTGKNGSVRVEHGGRSHITQTIIICDNIV